MLAKVRTGLARVARGVLRRLGDPPTLGPEPPPVANISYNRWLWDKYSQRWEKGSIPIENTAVDERSRASYIQHLGDEWGRLEDVEKIVGDYIVPYVGSTSVVAEIGSGGGRVASRVGPLVANLRCFDISEGMLQKAREALVTCGNVDFVLLETAQLPTDCVETFDFVYSFDVFVHLDLHTMWKYFLEIQRVLKSGGRAFLHTANLRAPGGWKAFAGQDAFRVEGHYFVCPEIIDILAEKSGLKVVKTSTPDPTNFYLNRDFLFVLEKG